MRWRTRTHAVLLAAVGCLVISCSAEPEPVAGVAPDSSVTSASTQPSNSEADIQVAGTEVESVPLGEPITSTSPTIASPTAAGPTAANPAAESVPAGGASTDTAGAALPCPGVRCLTLTVTGDVLLHERLWEQAGRDAGTAGGWDFGPLLAAQVPYVATSDVAICHLETPVAPTEGPYEGYPNFSVPPQILSALVNTGYDGCSTASNHSNDHGTDGIDRTLDALDAAGLAHAGTARTAGEAATPTLIDTPNGVLALISATYDLNGAETEFAWQAEKIDPATIIDQAAAATAAGADLVVVALHAGVEYQNEPTQQQHDLAAQLLGDENIDLVYGHHAHVVQPIEQVNGKWAVYGLGNTVAAHGISDLGNREGLLVRIQFSQDAAGRWTSSDLAWVPSLVDDAEPYRWCSLIGGTVCSDAEADAVSLDRITEVVNSLGAAEAGAHLFPDAN